MAYKIVLGMDFLIKYRMKMALGEKTEISFDGPTKDERITINAITRKQAEEILNDILERNKEIFNDEIGLVKKYKHRIEITSQKPYKSKTYPIPEVHRKKIIEHIRELEKQEIVKKASTQYINPLVIVVKKNGDIRLCLDARELNKRSKNDHAQPPTIEEVFRRIGHKKYFTTLDVSKAFWQIPLEEDSQQYTGFMFENQSYVFRRMPFGLKTAGGSFTRAMHKALGQDCSSFLSRRHTHSVEQHGGTYGTAEFCAKKIEKCRIQTEQG